MGQFLIASLDVGPIDRNREDDDGVIALGTVDDAASQPTALRPDGLPLRMVVDEGRGEIVLSNLAGAVDDWRSGPDETSADIADLTAIAERLDRDADAYSAEITLFGNDRPDGPLGTGTAHAGIGGDQRTIVVVLFRDDAAAAAALPDIEAAAEAEGEDGERERTFRADSFEVDGRAVVVRGLALTIRSDRAEPS